MQELHRSVIRPLLENLTLRTAAFLFAGGMLVTTSAPMVQGQTQHDLPPGHYEYLGRTPGRGSVKRFTVDQDGGIHWDSNPETPPSSDGSSTNAKTSADGFEEYAYPLIKWKGKRLLGSAKADGWLTTTYESGGIKYQITVEVESGLILSNESVIKTAKKKGLTVELLDANLFKIAEIIIPGSVLHETSKPSIVEGRGFIQIPEPLYEKTRNITIR